MMDNVAQAMGRVGRMMVLAAVDGEVQGHSGTDCVRMSL
jgi:hypothetical protein